MQLMGFMACFIIDYWLSSTQYDSYQLEKTDMCTSSHLENDRDLSASEHALEDIFYIYVFSQSVDKAGSQINAITIIKSLAIFSR